ncbi:hypothetical protein FHT76_000789 [Rhizobium sp. BK176]|nr:hypothetical protein [Rhizobium sp. BK176]
MNVGEVIETLKQLPPDAPFCRVDPYSDTGLTEIVSIHRERGAYKSEEGQRVHSDMVIYVR